LFTTEGLGRRRVLDAPEVIDAALAFVRGGSVGQPFGGFAQPAIRRGLEPRLAHGNPRDGGATAPAPS
jgi:hypothetical protein